MRKLILGLFLVSMASFGEDYVDSLPNGHFVGEGAWEDNYGSSGSYTTDLEILNNLLTVDYAWENETITLQLLFQFTNAGQFDVIHGGNVVGAGYCEPSYCEYDLTIGDAHIIEGLHFDYDAEGALTLSKIGQEITGDHVVSWEDGLALVNADDGDPPIPILEPVPGELAPIEDPAQQQKSSK